MRITPETPPWRILAHGAYFLFLFAGFLFGTWREIYDLSAVFAVLLLIYVIEDARDRILDRLEEVRR